MRKKELPTPMPQFMELQVTGPWQRVHSSFFNCASFNPTNRPEVSEILNFLENG